MNFESVSESDPNISKDSSKIDETEMQLVAESRGIHLEDLNEHLQKENSKLRAQFDEAIRSNSQIGELHQKIQTLSANVNELKSQNDELKNRLSLAIQANDDLTMKYEEEKENYKEQMKNEISNFENEIDRSNQKLKDTIESHQIIVSEFESDKEKIIVDLKTSQDLVSRLLIAAEHFFETRFKNPDDLVTFLNKPPLKVQEFQDKFDISNSITVKNQQIASLEKKKRKLLIKLENQKKENEQLKNDLLDLQKDHCIQTQQYLDQIEELKIQMHAKEEENAIIDSENKHKIEALNSKIISLSNSSQRNINTSLSATPSSFNLMTAVPLTSSTSPAIQNLVNPIVADVRSTEKHNNKIVHLEDNLEDMTNKNAELSQKLSESEDKISILSEKLKSIENEKNDYKKEYEKVKTDFDALSLLHQNTMTEMQTIRIALRSREDPQVIASKKEKIKNLKERIENIEKELKNKDNQLNDLTNKYDEKIQMYENDKRSLKTENQILKNEVTSLEDQNRHLKEELGRRKIEQQFSFGSGNNGNLFIPSSPAPQIQKIAKNNINSDENKIYKKQLKKSMKLNDQLQKEKETFIASLSSLFSSKQISSPDDLDHLIDSISIMKKENESLNTIIRHLIDVFSLSYQYIQQNQLKVTPSYPIIDVSSIISQINELHSKFQKQKDSLSKKSSQNNHLQKTFSVMKEKIESLENQLQIKQDENQQLSSNLTKYEVKFAKMKRKIHSQKLQIANFEKIKDDADTSCSIQVDKLINERKRIENTLRDQLSDMSNMLSECQRQVQSLNDENMNLKKTIRNQKANIVELKLKLENSEKEINEKEETIKNSLNLEQSNLNKTIIELQNQLQNSRNEIEKLTKQLACAHKKLVQMRSCCQEIKIEKEKLIKEVQTLNEQIEREKQIAQANAKTQILKAQSEFTQKLDEQKGLCEKEKRKYFTYVADQFRQFFNPQEVIDEKSFREVILRVKNELSKVTSHDC